MLGYKNRFHGHGSLKYVYSNGKSVRSRLISLKTTAHPRRHDPRVAVVVSKKVVKGAVPRNRIRRRIYEVVRHELPQIQPGRDIILIVFSAEVLTTPSQTLTETVQQLLREGGVYRQ
jgi:ribonuclease P protein component|tara:strand:+ start:30090 stop:30440 length:351 start_codon:yes stop_codon:yes gene_type:complete